MALGIEKHARIISPGGSGPDLILTPLPNRFDPADSNAVTPPVGVVIDNPLPFDDYLFEADAPQIVFQAAALDITVNNADGAAGDVDGWTLYKLNSSQIDVYELGFDIIVNDPEITPGALVGHYKKLPILTFDSAYYYQLPLINEVNWVGGDPDLVSLVMEENSISLVFVPEPQAILLPTVALCLTLLGRLRQK